MSSEMVSSLPTAPRSAGLLRGRTPVQAARDLWAILSSRWKARRCASVGGLVRIEGRVLIEGDGPVRLGKRVRIRGTHVPVELAACGSGQLTIGEGTFINGGTSICAVERIQIGRNVAIGNYTLIMDTDFHTPGDHTAAPVPSPVVIEDDAWLGARVTVLKGVTIGQGATVAAGAVVTRDVPPHTLVAGVPARVIRQYHSGGSSSAPV